MNTPLHRPTLGTRALVLALRVGAVAVTAVLLVVGLLAGLAMMAWLLLRSVFGGTKPTARMHWQHTLHQTMQRARRPQAHVPPGDIVDVQAREVDTGSGASQAASPTPTPTQRLR
ncbi:hypothetical protein ACPOLB_21510 [Rubrivivax sp. RP6-9]|uniref:hypothetical protein n=1 Tax=Rubrivivax sp. RP6-9 TaxID=3415750 RepID=UPI003CC58DE0